MKLGYLGPKGTFSYEAAKKNSENDELVGFKTIVESINALQMNEINRAIVPIENSIQGGVRETIDGLIETEGIYVNREFVLKIKQNLIANKKYKLDEIKEIYSHPQALGQCRKYIEKNCKNAIINQVSSTALAAKEIKDKDFCACIASESCLTEYGLELLDENIQDNNFNQTKFWVISKDKNTFGNKMSLVFTTKNEPGALYKILGIFDANKVNLTKIESRPNKAILGDYIFWVDLEINDSIEKAIKELQRECKYLRILGIY